MLEKVDQFGVVVIWAGGKGRRPFADREWAVLISGVASTVEVAAFEVDSIIGEYDIDAVEGELLDVVLNDNELPVDEGIGLQMLTAEMHLEGQHQEQGHTNNFHSRLIIIPNENIHSLNLQEKRCATPTFTKNISFGWDLFETVFRPFPIKINAYLYVFYSILILLLNTQMS